MFDKYVAQMEALIKGYAIVQDFTINSRHEEDNAGHIRGWVIFLDATTLHFRECLDLALNPPRLSYSYHYMDASQQILFRYDDTAHPNLLHLANYPHHKHAGSEATILPSSPPDLPTVLQEILVFFQPI